MGYEIMKIIYFYKKAKNERYDKNHFLVITYADIFVFRYPFSLKITPSIYVILISSHSKENHTGRNGDVWLNEGENLNTHPHLFLVFYHVTSIYHKKYSP